MFLNTYKGKKVIVTGHTGFKGTWLSTWLIKLGANVIGVSKDIPTNPSMFNELNLSKQLKHIVEDVRNLSALKTIIDTEQPDFVFHLAAQAIVSTSYSDPVETMSTNVIGTMNIMEVLRNFSKPCTAIMITSDKCYENVEWIWGYKETDKMGGNDVYSGSKGAAELVIKSYIHSFFSSNHPVKIAIGRAGNVIGGGDWAQDRIVVDCMRAWSNSQNVEIRSPNATRPWQHVLEPLSGYLQLGEALTNDSKLHGEAFNFGPRAEQSHSVVSLIRDLAKQWGFSSLEEAYKITGNIPFHEASLLKLNCDKALYFLKWESNLNYSETISLISSWYLAYYSNKSDLYEITLNQIGTYEKFAFDRKRAWAKNLNENE